MSKSVPDFGPLLRSAERSAVHLEMHDSYAVESEAEEFALWQSAGRRWEGGRAEAYWRPWTDLVAETVARGVEVRRARVVSEPVSEYIRFEHAATDWNVGAGERVAWLPRRLASDLALPGNDFWLIDDRAVRFNLFAGDGSLVDPDYTEDPRTVAMCADAFAAVWERAIPHAEFVLQSP
ncbi:DUF6879 family protein [Streptomyces sp. RKAG337]|uniref:DUF6879 family protein n=1 Tax=Streptomyces sp. RKAG337 TaxID=2893404 RepID=UPI002034225D|nr:DUF6879 family protein [Streptomyces sp. RKAG337]MCM2430152.1 hypothetical protein [Streptomyces sp. RKAG337]